MSTGKDPDHPILEAAELYRIVGLSYLRSPGDADEPYIDLTLQKDQHIRRLRFYSPRDISFHEDFPHCSGLFIADVRGRNMEGLSVRVGNLEQGTGIWFWARDVVDLDAK